MPTPHDALKMQGSSGQRITQPEDCPAAILPWPAPAGFTPCPFRRAGFHTNCVPKAIREKIVKIKLTRRPKNETDEHAGQARTEFSGGKSSPSQPSPPTSTVTRAPSRGSSKDKKIPALKLGRLALSTHGHQRVDHQVAWRSPARHPGPKAKARMKYSDHGRSAPKRQSSSPRLGMKP
jgi:hypothetical protein